MKYKLQRFFRNIAIENLMTYIAASMAIIFVGDLLTQGMFTPLLCFNRSAILKGEVWRLVTFLMLPQTNSPIWIVFSVYFYYFIGKTVENGWGSRNLTLYFLTGALLLLVNGFATGVADASYLYFSLFLVYAYLNPHHRLLLFMIIPIEAKWIAIIDSVFMLLEWANAFLIYPISPVIALGMQLSVLTGFITFGIFFGKDYIGRFKNKRRHKDFLNSIKKDTDKNRLKIKVVKTQRDEDNEKDDRNDP